MNPPQRIWNKNMEHLNNAYFSRVFTRDQDLERREINRKTGGIFPQITQINTENNQSGLAYLISVHQCNLWINPSFG